MLYKNILVLLIIISFLPWPGYAQGTPDQIWDRGLDSDLSSAAISPDGSTLALGFSDGRIQVIDERNRLLWTFQTGKPVRAIGVSSKGTVVAAASEDEVLFFEGGAFKWSKTLGLLRDLSLSGDGKGLAALGRDKVFFLNKNGEVTRELPIKGDFGSLALAPDGNGAAVGGLAGIDHFVGSSLQWSFPLDLTGGFEDVELRRGQDAVYGLSIKGGYVAAGTRNGFYYLLSDQGEPSWSVDLQYPVLDVDIDEMGSIGLAGTEKGAFLLLEAEPERLGPEGAVVAVGLSKDGRSLFLAFERDLYFYRYPVVTPLEVRITSPVDGSRVSGEVELSFKAQGETGATLYLDEIPLSGKSGYNLDTRLVQNGPHTIRVRARNDEGNTTEDSVGIFVDNGANLAPSVKIVSPGEGEFLSGTARIFAITNLLFEDLSISIDGVEVSKGYSYSWDTRGYSEGAHEISVVGRRLGEAYSDSITVFVDNKPDNFSPAVKIFYPFPGELVDGTIAVRGVFLKEPKEVYVSLDGRVVSKALPFIWNTSLVSYGSHTLTVFALDEKGNIGTDTVKVTRQEPRDPDGDGWSNEKEKLYRTDPNNPDTDSDGILDGSDPDPLRSYVWLYTLFKATIFVLLIEAFLLKYWDLRALLLLTLLAAIFVALPPFSELLLKVPSGIFLVFFASGYPFISLAFPKNDISGIERFTLSVVFSIVIFIFTGFVLNYTWGFRAFPIVLSLSGLVALFTLLAAILRHRTPFDTRYLPSAKLPTFSDAPLSRIEKTLITALLISIILSGAMFVYAKLTFQQEQFSALYILGEKGIADDYPKGFFLGRDYTITVGADNFEKQDMNYRLEVRLDDALIAQESFFVPSKGTWINNVLFKPNRIGDRLKLDFQLYRENDAKPYRSVHLWVTVYPNFADPASYENYMFDEKPFIENGDFGIIGLWRLNHSKNKVSIDYVNNSFISPPSALKISIKSDNDK